MKRALLALLAALVAGCVSPRDDLLGLRSRPPLDRAVLVSGGAFLAATPTADGTFQSDEDLEAERDAEAIPFAAIVDVLDRAAVFQRVVADPDAERRARLGRQLRTRDDDAQLAAFLRQARDQGFDLLLVIEELQDGPIESLGTNDRWPVTFATWILLGVGALIPDHTFESRAALRVSLRELQTGRELDYLLLVPGRVELALTERTDLLGLLMSILVPPFWVPSDPATLRRSVRDTAERRLLLSMARDLKSEAMRRKLAELAAARIDLVGSPEGPEITVESRESLSAVALRAAGLGDATPWREFERELLRSGRIEGERFLYRALLPRIADGQPFQVRVATLRGGIASATFRLGSAR
ncbi:MAG TPA: hypothetical protein ENI87_09775 [bacterium]|nr:hypothetical protein [bacterium]